MGHRQIDYFENRSLRKEQLWKMLCFRNDQTRKWTISERHIFRNNPLFELIVFEMMSKGSFVPWHNNTWLKIFQKFVTLTYLGSEWKNVEPEPLLLLRNSTQILRFRTTLRRIFYTKKIYGNLGQSFIKISFLKPRNQILFMKALRDILSKKVL